MVLVDMEEEEKEWKASRGRSGQGSDSLLPPFFFIFNIQMKFIIIYRQVFFGLTLSKSLFA